jgi:hypothetical protein
VAARTFTRLGDDLALTRFTAVPGAVPLEQADSGGALDLAVVPGDLATVSGRATLAQALIVRLLTPRGSLAPLGHAGYGSRLGELIGRVNTDATRNLARLHTIEALAQERRVRAVRNLTVEVPPGSPDSVRISFSVLPVADDDPLALTLDVSL